MEPLRTLYSNEDELIVSDHSPQNILNRTTLESGTLVGESILYDIFVKYGKPKDEKMAKLKDLYEVEIQSNANRRKSTSDLSYKELLMECACDLFTEMVLAFNILLIGLISPYEHLKFFFDQTAYVDKHLLELPKLIEKRLRSMTSLGFNERKLAKVFIKLIKQAYKADIPGSLRE